MKVLALLASLAWLFYLLVLDIRLSVRIDAALVSVPTQFATILKWGTLLAAFLLPSLLTYFVLARIGAAIDGPSPEQMLEAVRAGHRQAIAASRALIDQTLEGLSEADAAAMRPSLEEVHNRAVQDARLREERYAQNPDVMRQELLAAIADVRAKQRPG